MKSLSDYIMEFPITEMAIKLGEFRNKCEGLIIQVIQNWCLTRWCDLNPNSEISKRLRNHWTSELINNLIQISTIKLKSNNKNKALKNLLFNTMELDYPSEVANYIRKKFENEGLQKYINIIAEDCANHIYDIYNIMTDDEKSIKEYVYGKIICDDDF